MYLLLCVNNFCKVTWKITQIMDQKPKSCERSSSTPNQNSFGDSFPRAMRGRKMIWIYFSRHFDFTPWPPYCSFYSLHRASLPRAKPTWCYVHKSWIILSFKPNTWLSSCLEYLFVVQKPKDTILYKYLTNNIRSIQWCKMLHNNLVICNFIESLYNRLGTDWSCVLVGSAS